MDFFLTTIKFLVKFLPGTMPVDENAHYDVAHSCFEKSVIIIRNESI